MARRDVVLYLLLMKRIGRRSIRWYVSPQIEDLRARLVGHERQANTTPDALRAELARAAFAAMSDLVEDARLRQGKRAAEIARLQDADAARVEAVEAAHGLDGAHAACSVEIVAFVK